MLNKRNYSTRKLNYIRLHFSPSTWRNYSGQS